MPINQRTSYELIVIVVNLLVAFFIIMFSLRSWKVIAEGKSLKSQVETQHYVISKKLK